MKCIGKFLDHSDGTIKNVYEDENKKIIEVTLLFNKEGMDVVCVPTHHFCNLGCKMCHLTNNKLNKMMMPVEVKSFVKCLITTLLINDNERITNNRKLLISFMGVGEPLLNLELLKELIKYESLIKEYGYDDIGYAISTMMPNTNTIKLMNLVNENNIPLKLHFSLHTPDDIERKRLIPATMININDALTYLVEYKETIMKNKTIMNEYTKFHRNNIPVEIHYTLIAGINDSDECLSKICDLLSIYPIPIKFIRFNPINNMAISKNEEKWVSTLKSKFPNLNIKTYTPPGREIGSSCGEFTKHYYHEDIETEQEKEEFNQWKEEHEVTDEIIKRLKR